MLSLVQSLPHERIHAMLVGHNPGMHSFGASLPGSGDEAALNALDVKYPTAALAVITFEGDWASVAARTGYLQRFVLPRELNGDK